VRSRERRTRTGRYQRLLSLTPLLWFGPQLARTVHAEKLMDLPTERGHSAPPWSPRSSYLFWAQADAWAMRRLAVHRPRAPCMAQATHSRRPAAASAMRNPPTLRSRVATHHGDHSDGTHPTHSPNRCGADPPPYVRPIRVHQVPGGLGVVVWDAETSRHASGPAAVTTRPADQSTHYPKRRLCVPDPPGHRRSTSSHLNRARRGPAPVVG
jgi:hypothetical protein